MLATLSTSGSLSWSGSASRSERQALVTRRWWTTNEGWDTYRIALACIMRGVPQQVAVTFREVPPL
jgi:hypothetical protein